MRGMTLLFIFIALGCENTAVKPSQGDWLLVFEPKMGQTIFAVRSDSTITINVILSDSTGSYPHQAVVKYPRWTGPLYSNDKVVGAFNGGFSSLQPTEDGQPWGSGIWLSDSIWNSESRSGYFFIYKIK